MWDKFMTWWESTRTPNPKCSNCQFMTSYQSLNNRDELDDINHCPLMGATISSIKTSHLNTEQVSINDPENFSCSKHVKRIN